jgi:D-sedoheptulose 7-phosphate isomerase
MSASAPSLARGRSERGARAALLARLGEDRIQRVEEVNRRFFECEADHLAQACWAMARRFHRGGRLFVFAGAASASDARHVAVEFLHPVLVGKRALPAMAVDGDVPAQLRLMGHAQDIAMGICGNGEDERVCVALGAARAMGLLAIGLAGGSGGRMAQALPDHLFVVPDDDPTIVQEVQETCYHVLYELVHVFFEHRSLL